MGFYSLWGVLFIFWAILSIRSGEAFLVEPISRTGDPILFWAITAMWVFFGGLYILADLYPAA